MKQIVRYSMLLIVAVMASVGCGSSYKCDTPSVVAEAFDTYEMVIRDTLTAIEYRESAKAAGIEITPEQMESMRNQLYNTAKRAVSIDPGMADIVNAVDKAYAELKPGFVNIVQQESKDKNVCNCTAKIDLQDVLLTIRYKVEKDTNGKRVVSVYKPQ